MGLGDSMMAGFAAGHGPDIFHLGLLQENREVSFGSGIGSSDHRTLPYYLKQYNASLTGASSGVHPLETPVGSGIAGGMFDGYRYPEDDQLNMALSIGQSWDLRQEIQQLKVLSKSIDGFADRWKVLTLMIGANDLSHSSACTNTSQSQAVANTFAFWVEDALRDIVQSFDKIYINVIGLPRLADLGKLLNNYASCKLMKAIRYEEINCIVESSPQKLSLLAKSEELVDDKLRTLVAKYNHYTSNHAVVYHSLFRNSPLPSRKWVSWDCTHPSSLAHNASATLLWNSMFASPAQRNAMALVQNPEPVCPTPDSAFQSDVDDSFPAANSIVKYFV